LPAYDTGCDLAIEAVNASHAVAEYHLRASASETGPGRAAANNWPGSLRTRGYSYQMLDETWRDEGERLWRSFVDRTPREPLLNDAEEAADLVLLAQHGNAAPEHEG
jgi:hypothetical protein